MIIVENPAKGATIKGFVLNKKVYNLALGEKKQFDDEVGNALLDRYEFLKEVKGEGKYNCKYGDYSSNYKVAVVQHEKSHTEEPTVEEGTEFITPQEQLDEEKRSLYAKEDDAEGLEGEGLEIDAEYMRPNVRRPGAF
jgi:hypothetical protein